MIGMDNPRPLLQRQITDTSDCISAVAFGCVCGGGGEGANRPRELQLDIKNNVMDSPQWPLAHVAAGQEEKKKVSRKGKKKKKQDKQSATSLGRLLP